MEILLYQKKCVWVWFSLIQLLCYQLHLQLGKVDCVTVCSVHNSTHTILFTSKVLAQEEAHEMFLLILLIMSMSIDMSLQSTRVMDIRAPTTCTYKNPENPFRPSPVGYRGGDDGVVDVD